jgi:hypothetical protein
MGGTCSMHGYMRNAYIFFKNSDGKIPRGKLRYRVKIMLMQIWCECVDWMVKLAHSRI